MGWESDLRIGLTAKTTHYVYEHDSVIPLAKVQYTQAIGLVTAPDYDTLIVQGYDIAQDPLWNHQPQLHRPVIEQIAYYHFDHLGTPQELTDRDGQLLWSAHYKAWGEAKVQRSESAKHLRIDNYHRYQGQYFDSETGLHYNRFRYYDPHLARYISRDPIGLNGGMNLNAYVPNPNQWIDPLGLQFNFGGMVGIESQAAQSSIASEGYRQYECWLKTGNRCVINIEPLFDYAVCQRGNRVEVYNFHNGNIYTGYSGSLFEHKGKAKLGDIASKSNNAKYKIGSSSLDKVKEMFSASCAVGYIMNKDLKRYKIDQAVDNFVTGMGVNVTGNYKFITLGVTKPANSDLLDLKSPTAIEVGLSTTRSGVSVNTGYTFDQKVIKTQ